MSTEQARERLDEFLSQFEVEEQERLIRYALDHVVPRMKKPALATPQPAAPEVDLEALWKRAVAAYESQTDYPYSTEGMERVIETVLEAAHGITHKEKSNA